MIMRDAELDEGNDVCASNRRQNRIALKIFKKKSKEAIVIDFVLLYTVTFFKMHLPDRFYQWCPECSHCLFLCPVCV